MEDPKAVALLAGLVRAFRAGDIEMRFDETERAILDMLSGEGLVDLSNDGFRLTQIGGLTRSFAGAARNAQGNSFFGAPPHRRIHRPAGAVPLSRLVVTNSKRLAIPESSLVLKRGQCGPESVIPAPLSVIPAKAGIQVGCGARGAPRGALI